MLERVLLLCVCVCVPVCMFYQGNRVLHNFIILPPSHSHAHTHAHTQIHTLANTHLEGVLRVQPTILLPHSNVHCWHWTALLCVLCCADCLCGRGLQHVQRGRQCVTVQAGHTAGNVVYLQKERSMR